MDELQQALDRYLAAAAAELARRGAARRCPSTPQSRMLRSDDLKDLIETARQLARTGGRDERDADARGAAAHARRYPLRPAVERRQARTVAEAQALMQALRDLADRQQRLLDDSFQRLREQQSRQDRGERSSSGREGPRDRSRTPAAPSLGPSPDAMIGGPSGSRPGGAGKGGGAAEQQALRGELGELMLRLDQFLGSIPQPLGDADQAMRAPWTPSARAGSARRCRGRPAPSMRWSGPCRCRRQAMAQRLGEGMALGEEDGSGDIFGRRPDGRRGFASGTLKIPDRGSLQRAQEIVDELRRRAAERSRPADELDYIERLLRRF